MVIETFDTPIMPPVHLAHVNRHILSLPPLQYSFVKTQIKITLYFISLTSSPSTLHLHSIAHELKHNWRKIPYSFIGSRHLVKLTALVTQQNEAELKL